MNANEALLRRVQRLERLMLNYALYEHDSGEWGDAKSELKNGLLLSAQEYRDDMQGNHKPTTHTWVGKGDRYNWFDGRNWDTGSYPGDGDNAIIPKSGLSMSMPKITLNGLYATL